MAKFKYSFTITEAPVTYAVDAEVPSAIKEAADSEGIELVAKADPLNGSLQLGTIDNGELVLVLVKVTAEKEAVQKGDDLRQEIQKMMFI